MALKRKISPLNDEPDFRLFLYITKRTLLPIIILLVIAAAGAFLYLRYTHPMYETRLVMQVNLGEETSKILNVGNLYEEGLQKKIVLLRSPLFLNRALSRLNLGISYFIEGNILSFEQFQSAPYKVSARVKDPAVYGTPVSIVFNRDLGFRISYRDSQNALQAGTGTPDKTLFLKDMDLTVSFDPGIQAKELINGIASNKYFFIINNPDKIVPEMTRRLSTSIQDASANTILIRFQDRNPNKAAQIINTLATEFQVFDVEQKQESANNILNFIDTQLEQIKDSLISSEEQIQQFRKDNKVDSVYVKAVPSLLVKIGDLEDRYNQAGLEDAGLAEMEKYFSTTREPDSYRLLAYLSVGMFPDPVVSLLSPMRDLLLQKEKLYYSVTPNSGQIKSIEYQIGVQTRLIVQTIRSYRENLKEQRQELKQLLDRYRTEVAGNTNQFNVLELARLQRIYSINERYYNQLIETKANYAIAKAGYVSQNIILNNSEIPAVPLYPRPKMVYFLCLLVAGLAGLAVILIKYLAYNEILSIQDILKYTDIPVLGVIPKYTRSIPQNMMIVDIHPKSVFTESLRAVRTNLQFIRNVEGPRVITITSTVSGEGKTFLAINLAGMLTFASKKVILLDMDMRKPKIHQKFQVDNHHGMSTILSGMDPVESSIHHYPQLKLDFIPSGPIPPNPSELILSDQMKSLIDRLKTVYEYILLDTPPAGVVTDSIPCLQLADYPVYVLKANYSKKIFIENADRLSTQNQISNLSLILNAVEPLAKSYDYTKGYGYGYGHGYGYGSGYGYGFDYSYYDEDDRNGDRTPLLNRFFRLFKRK